MNNFEKSARQIVFDHISQAISLKWPIASTHIFGSYVTNTSTYLSDLDISVIKNENDRNGGVDIKCEDLSWSLDSRGDDTLQTEANEESEDESVLGNDISLNISEANPEDIQHSTTNSIISKSEKKKKNYKVIDDLRILCTHLEKLGFVKRTESRFRAKTPIVVLLFDFDVSCDINLTATNNTPHVMKLINSGSNPDTFRSVVMFLKMLLHQIHYDDAGTGGLGSYKIYAMLANIIITSKREKAYLDDPGILLLEFLKYYGTQNGYLHSKTKFEIYGVTIGFEHNYNIKMCSLYFQRSYDILQSMSPTRDATQVSKGRIGLGKGHASFLAMILPNVDKIRVTRELSSNKCSMHCAWNNNGKREEVAVGILNHIQTRLQTHQTATTVTMEELKQANPFVGFRLMSYKHVNDAIRHIPSRKNHSSDSGSVFNKAKHKQISHSRDNGLSISSNTAKISMKKYNEKRPLRNKELLEVEDYDEILIY